MAFKDHELLALWFSKPLKQRADGIFRGTRVGRADTPDPDKTGLLHQCQLVSHGDRTAYSLRPGIEVAGHGRRQLPVQDNIGKLHPAAGLKNSQDFPE